ncbi:UNVERIFIED_CONTAM: hypothetical protein FKN15_053697 [Acipenser sinensis]
MEELGVLDCDHWPEELYAGYGKPQHDDEIVVHGTAQPQHDDDIVMHGAAQPQHDDEIVVHGAAQSQHDDDIVVHGTAQPQHDDDIVLSLMKVINRKSSFSNAESAVMEKRGLLILLLADNIATARVKLNVPKGVNLEDPKVYEAILEQIREHLSKNFPMDGVNLRWRKQDGEIFHKEEEEEQEEMEKYFEPCTFLKEPPEGPVSPGTRTGIVFAVSVTTVTTIATSLRFELRVEEINNWMQSDYFQQLYFSIS